MVPRGLTLIKGPSFTRCIESILENVRWPTKRLINTWSCFSGFISEFHCFFQNIFRVRDLHFFFVRMERIFENFFIKNNYIFAFSYFFYAYVRETRWTFYQLDFQTSFVFEFKYFYYITQCKSSSTLRGTPISVEMEINYPYNFMVHQKSTSLPVYGPTE